MTKTKLQVKYDRHAINPLEWNDVKIHKQQKRPEGYDTVLPLYKYEHSKVAYNTSGFRSSWDSGRVGWVTSDYLDNGELSDFIESEYTDWCNGEVLALTVLQSDTCECCGNTNWEVKDNIAGIYGYGESTWEEIAHDHFDIEEINEIEKPF